MYGFSQMLVTQLCDVILYMQLFYIFFTQNVRVKIMMDPIVEWIQEDVSDLNGWCNLVYAVFFHLVM